MTGHTHDLAEWAAFLSLGLGFWASCAAVLYLTYDADLPDLDPRPALRTAGDRVLVETVRARHTLRDALLWATALLMLLSPAAPKGATQ